jgi:hypothetical protein
MAFTPMHFALGQVQGPNFTNRHDLHGCGGFFSFVCRLLLASQFPWVQARVEGDAKPISFTPRRIDTPRPYIANCPPYGLAVQLCFKYKGFCAGVGNADAQTWSLGIAQKRLRLHIAPASQPIDKPSGEILRLC